MVDLYLINSKLKNIQGSLAHSKQIQLGGSDLQILKNVCDFYLQNLVEKRRMKLFNGSSKKEYHLPQNLGSVLSKMAKSKHYKSNPAINLNWKNSHSNNHLNGQNFNEYGNSYNRHNNQNHQNEIKSSKSSYKLQEISEMPKRSYYKALKEFFLSESLFKRFVNSFHKEDYYTVYSHFFKNSMPMISEKIIQKPQKPPKQKEKYVSSFNPVDYKKIKPIKRKNSRVHIDNRRFKPTEQKYSKIPLNAGRVVSIKREYKRIPSETRRIVSIRHEPARSTLPSKLIRYSMPRMISSPYLSGNLKHSYPRILKRSISRSPRRVLNRGNSYQFLEQYIRRPSYKKHCVPDRMVSSVTVENPRSSKYLVRKSKPWNEIHFTK